MIKQYFNFLLLLLAIATVFSSCQSGRQYYLYSPSAGAYHQADKTKAANKAEAEARLAEIEPAQIATPAPAVTHAKPAKAKEATGVSPNLTASASIAPAPETIAPDYYTAKQAEIQTADLPAAQPSQAQNISGMQKLALKKVQKMAQKAATKMQKAEKPGQPLAVKALHNYLKLAIIFGIASIIAGLFNGFIGLILLIVALVFLILWVADL